MTSKQHLELAVSAQNCLITLMSPLLLEFGDSEEQVEAADLMEVVAYHLKASLGAVTRH